MSPIGIRRIACALALPAFPLALLAGTLVSPTDSTDNAVQLRAAAAHGTSWQAAALLELLAAALMPLVFAGVVQLVHRRGAALAVAGAAVGVLGTLGMTSIAFRHLYVYGLAGGDATAGLHALDRLDNGAGLVALPLMVAGPITFLLLSGAVARAGLASRWVILGAFLYMIGDSLPIPAAEEIQGLIGIATFGTIAMRMLRLRDGESPARSTRLATAEAGG